MSRALEVFYVPLLFLTVTLVGGLRVADRRWSSRCCS